MSGVASKKPDILAVGGHDTVLIDAVKACKSVKFTPKAIIMHYGVTEPSFATELKQDADGVCGLVDWTPEFPYRDDIFGTFMPPETGDQFPPGGSENGSSSGADWPATFD